MWRGECLNIHKLLLFMEEYYHNSLNISQHVSTRLNTSQHISTCHYTSQHASTCNTSQHISNLNTYYHFLTCLNTSQHVSTRLNMSDVLTLLNVSQLSIASLSHLRAFSSRPPWCWAGPRCFQILRAPWCTRTSHYAPCSCLKYFFQF